MSGQEHERDRARRIALSRLEAIWRGLQPALQRGEISATNLALRIIDREVKLLGLDVVRPKPVAPPPTTARPYQDLPDEELDQIICRQIKEWAQDGQHPALTALLADLASKTGPGENAVVAQEGHDDDTGRDRGGPTERG